MNLVSCRGCVIKLYLNPSADSTMCYGCALETDFTSTPGILRILSCVRILSCSSRQVCNSAVLPGGHMNSLPDTQAQREFDKC